LHALQIKAGRGGLVEVFLAGVVCFTGFRFFKFLKLFKLFEDFKELEEFEGVILGCGIRAYEGVAYERMRSSHTGVWGCAISELFTFILGLASPTPLSCPAALQDITADKLL
jgi:hypothetical protein